MPPHATALYESSAPSAAPDAVGSAGLPTAGDRPLRVVHWCGAFSPLSETFIYDQVKALQSLGVHNDVVTYRRLNEKTRPFDAVYTLRKDAGFWFHKSWQAMRAKADPGASAAVYWPPPSRARAALESLRPDVIHAHFGHRAVSVSRLAKDLGIPVVATFYGYDATALARKPAWRRRYQSLFDNAQVIQGISNHICRRVRELGAPEHKVVRHAIGIDLRSFPWRAPQPPAQGEPIDCLHVGRLVEKKGPVQLVESFAKACALLGPDRPLRLTLAGDGPLRPQVEAAIAEHGVSDRVRLLGSTPHDQVRRLVRASHLYTQHCVTASDGDQEGLGITFGEAAATGLPVVTTRHNGIPDIVLDGKTGVLVPEHDTDAMADAIASLAAAPLRWRPMAEAGRRHIEAHFCLQKQANGLIDLYRRALGVPAHAEATTPALSPDDTP
ncbi:MAG: glycosyltransferase [Planctomycetota bacterium]